MTRLAVNDHIEAVLRRSARRRTIAIKVQRGQVQVNAPTSVPISDIQAFLQEKARWIERHLARQQTLLAEATRPQYREGDITHFKGQIFTLRLLAEPTEAYADAQHLWLYDCGEVAARSLRLANWYIAQAAIYLPQRLEYWAPRLGVTPKGIKIRFYKSRWGSCSRHGELQFNWLIMMAPIAVIDYVVVHELAHLRYFNHSAAFWALVARHLPDFQQHRQWLKQQTHLRWALE